MSDPKRLRLYYSDPLEPEEEEEGSEDYEDEDEESEDEEDVEAEEEEEDSAVEESSDGDNDEISGEFEDRNSSGYFKLAKRLHTLLLTAAQPVGSFGYSNRFRNAPNPGIHIQGFGHLRLPVSAEDVERIFKMSSSESSVFDRDIEASAVEFRNPEWNAWFDQAKKIAFETLSIDAIMRPEAVLTSMVVSKPSGSIGFLVQRSVPIGAVANLSIFLPGEFDEDTGVSKISYGSECMNIRHKDCRYDIGAQAWFSDVQAIVEKPISPYIQLIYSIKVGLQTRVLTAARVAQPKTITTAVEAIRNSGLPAVFVLENLYSDHSIQSRAFEGRDPHIISNLIQAVNKVGDLALYCGDLETSDDREFDPLEEDDIEDYRIEPENPDEYDYDNIYTEYISHKLERLKHLAGTTWEFDRKTDWEGSILTFGDQLEDITPYKEISASTGWRSETSTERLYRSTCIVLWPTSVLKELRTKTQVPNLGWIQLKQILKSIGIPTERELPEFQRIKIQAIIRSCMVDSSGLYSIGKADLLEAGIALKEAMQSAPHMQCDEVAKSVKSIVADANPYGLGELKYCVVRFGKVLEMMRLFPNECRYLFYDAVERMLSRDGFIGLAGPKSLLDIYEVLEWKPETVLEEMLLAAIKGQPAMSTVDSINKTFEENLLPASEKRDIWNRVSANALEYVLMGVKLRLSRIAANDDFTILRNHEYFTPESVIGMGTLTQPKTLKIAPLKGADAVADSYFRLLLHTTDAKGLRISVDESLRLFDFCIEAIMPPDLAYFRQHDPKGKVNLYVRGRNSCVPSLIHQLSGVAKYLAVDGADYPHVKRSANASTFLERYAAIVKHNFECDKPPSERNLSLSSWPHCSKKSCILCGPLNKFLISPTQHTFKMKSQSGFKTHFVQVGKDLYNFKSRKPLKAVYSHTDSVLKVDIDGSMSRAGDVVLRVVKKHHEDYQLQVERFAKDVAERRKWLGMIGAVVDEDGHIVSGDYQSPAVASSSTGTKRKASNG